MELKWNNLETIVFLDSMSIRCYFLCEDGDIYVGKINKFNNLFGVNIKGRNGLKTKPKKWLPLTAKLFPDSYFI